jgi:tetraacyldisaccharide 4'-kinase
VSALSAIYGHAARLRRSWYEGHPSARRRLARPVISVGNLVVGGGGKTPVVAALARLLHDHGHRPAILSRGYARRRTTDGVVVVSDGEQVRAPVEESGDEPQMLARHLRGVPVLVCHDRYLAGRLAERRFDASVLLLDDGFQHLQLARSVDLLVASRQDLSERVLPSGLLREPLTAARSADAVLVYGRGEEAAHVAQMLGVANAFSVAVHHGVPWGLGTGQAIANGCRVVAVAGIARPQRFFTALRERGFDVARELAFRDHYWFSTADLGRIGAVARDVGANAIVTTAKDAVRLEPLVREPGIPWAVLPMDVTIEPAESFLAWLGPRV